MKGDEPLPKDKLKTDFRTGAEHRPQRAAPGQNFAQSQPLTLTRRGHDLQHTGWKVRLWAPTSIPRMTPTLAKSSFRPKTASVTSDLKPEHVR